MGIDAADVDSDGWQDVYITHLDFELNRLYHNNHDSEGFVHVEQTTYGMGYMSASDPRIHFGLGQRTKVDSLEITWPTGQVDHLSNVPIDRIIAVKEGTGIVPRDFPKITSPK
jgi:ASPIC and UnbV